MSTRLNPSFMLVATKVGSMILLVSLFGYFCQGYGQGKWWTTDYIYSLLIPVITAPVIVWLMFVPWVLEYSETAITIKTLLGKYIYPWEELYCYGSGRGVYKIQFSNDNQPYQIFAGAYPSDEWSKLIDLMKTRFPEREAGGFSFGVGMRPKGDR